MIKYESQQLSRSAKRSTTGSSGSHKPFIFQEQELKELSKRGAQLWSRLEMRHQSFACRLAMKRRSA
jgi:hypothetical protein